jgi:hypothetical protein
LACALTNSDLISKVFNGSTLILMNELLKFGYNVLRCEPDGLTYGYPTTLELSTAQAVFAKRLSNH